MKRVLVTGANGSIGRALCERMLGENFRVHGAVRPGKASLLPEGVEVAHIDSVDGDTDWKNTLEGVNTVVHLAARVHVMKDSSSNPFAEYRKVNVNGTERLAREAAFANVKRFIYMSSVKVHGEGRSTPYNEEDIQKPQDAYSVSKWEAEKVLNEISDETGMELVILRSPLVYGPRVKANFRSLMKWVHRGVPLPLGAVYNKRSFVALDNLVSFIIHCIDHPKAANEVFLISDGEDVSTTELLQKMARAFGKRSFLLPVPVGLMTFVAGLLGKRNVADRLFGSLQVDSSKARDLLRWEPVVSMDEGLKETAEWYTKKLVSC